MTVGAALRVAETASEARGEPAKGRNLIRPKIAISAVRRASDQTPTMILAPPVDDE
jgi:hypothetical protein